MCIKKCMCAFIEFIYTYAFFSSLLFYKVWVMGQNKKIEKNEM